MTVHTASALEGIVTADAPTAVLVARYAEAKRQAEDAENRVQALRTSLMEKFEAANALKFEDELGEVLIARTEVLTPEAVDISRLKREFPEAYAATAKERRKFFRLTLPRISRR